MALAASTWADEPVERKPGDFARSKSGTPYVAHPSETVKDGSRPKRVPYGRPSGFGKQIESTYNLQKWSERRVALGLGVDYAEACAAMAAPVLVAQAAKLVDGDRDTQDWKSDADAVVVEAKRLAKANLSAERGTHAHALTEDDDSERDWIARAEHGELLGLDRDVQQALVEAWRSMLERHGLEILAVEFTMVHDRYRLAGTGDRIARLTWPLRFTMPTGEIIELGAGTVPNLDIKTGKLQRDRNGVPMYWQSYAVQLAAYAGGQLYDPDTDTRTPYPWPVDQRWALIAHLDVLGALAGAPACELVLVDIEAGRAAADLCLAAKAWEKRSDIFSVSHISEALPDASDEQQSQDTHPATASTQQAPADIPPSAGATAPTHRVVGGPWPERIGLPCRIVPALRPRYPWVGKAANEVVIHIDDDPLNVGESFGVKHDNTEWTCVLAAKDIAPLTSAAPTPQELHARLRRHPDIDEGTVDSVEQLDTAFTRMAEHFLALPNTAKAWAAALQVQAQQHGCGFHAKEKHTLRRFELIRGLIVLCVAALDDDDLIRYLVHHVTGGDAALFPVITPGHALGSLDADEARAFAAAADQLAAKQIVLTFSDEGKPQFVDKAAA